MTIKTVIPYTCTGYPEDVVRRFWSKVDVRGADECWMWNAGTDGSGYGKIKINRLWKKANRVSWEIRNNKTLGSKLACHDCDTPLCCNPNHIYAGTKKTNYNDMVKRSRRAIVSFPGESNPNAKLRRNDINQIFMMIHLGMPNTVIGMYMGVHHSMIARIRNGKSW